MRGSRSYRLPRIGSGVGKLASAVLSLALLLAGQALAQQAGEDTTLVLVRPGNGGPATDLIGFEALVGGETIPVATDFGFIQESGDGYAIAGVRTRIGPEGLTALSCEGGLAPAALAGVFEGAYACTGEVPVPVAYQPANGALLPNLLDPNGVWEDDAFFVSALMSIRIRPARPVALPADALTPLAGAVPDTLDGLAGRVAPPGVQASGACGDAVAVFFPLAALPACADATLFDQE